jgi:hypothetical protein
MPPIPRLRDQLRPAVIARKLSCGNKTTAGTKTFQTLASIAATCAQKNASFIDLRGHRCPAQFQLSSFEPPQAPDRKIAPPSAKHILIPPG